MTTIMSLCCCLMSQGRRRRVEWRRLLSALAFLVALHALLLRGAEKSLFPYRTDHQYVFDAAQVRFEERAAFALRLDSPAALAAWPDGRLAVAGARELLLLGADGGEIARGRLPAGPATAVAVHGERVWVAVRDRALLFDTQARLTKSWESLGEQAVLTGIAASSNAVWLCDAGQRLIWRMGWEGRLQGLLPPPGAPRAAAFIVPSAGFAAAVAADGSFWVINPGRHQLQRHASEGSLLSSWSQPAQNAKGFAGCCNPAWLAVLPDGRLVTSEKRVPRVKIFTTEGKFVGWVLPPAPGRGNRALPVAADGAGVVYLLEGGRVRRFGERLP